MSAGLVERTEHIRQLLALLHRLLLAHPRRRAVVPQLLGDGRGAVQRWHSEHRQRLLGVRGADTGEQHAGVGSHTSTIRLCCAWRPALLASATAPAALKSTVPRSALLAARSHWQSYPPSLRSLPL